MSVTGSFTEHIRCILQHRRIEPPEEAFFEGHRPSEAMTCWDARRKLISCSLRLTAGTIPPSDGPHEHTR